MKKAFLFSIIAFVMAFTQACKKKGDGPTPQETTTNPNLLKTWKVSSVLEGTLDITSEFGSYRLTLTESGNNKTFILIDRQGTSTTGTWSISTDETTITLNATGGSSITFTGVGISANELKYTAAETGKNGQVNLSFTLIPA